MTDDQTALEKAQVQIDADALDAFVRAQRRTFKALVWFVAVATVVTVLFIGGLVGWLVGRSYASQDRTECITRTQAIGLGDLVDALKGTPATPGRNAKLERAATELAKLRDVGRVCG